MGVKKVFMGFIWREKGWSGLQGKSAEKNFRRELHCNLQIIRKSELHDNLKVFFVFLYIRKEISFRVNRNPSIVPPPYPAIRFPRVNCSYKHRDGY